MQEAFLHFLWQFQYFNRAHLQTVGGDALQVLHPGYHNTDAGPDFSQARIRVGDMEWAGNVEIHLKSSDWLAHHHHKDDAYDPVVLHVVWQHDREIFRKNLTPIPTSGAGRQNPCRPTHPVPYPGDECRTNTLRRAIWAGKKLVQNSGTGKCPYATATTKSIPGAAPPGGQP
jgi:hypothetical protein